MTPTECRIANWSQMGERDASQGQSDQIARYVDSCVKQQVPVSNQSVTQYRKGYQAGLQAYCQPEQILSLASAGKGNLSVCPAVQQTKLRPYYQAGRRHYDAQQALDTTDRKQRSLETELKKNETTDSRRQEIRQELRLLDQKLINQRLELNLADQLLQRLRPNTYQ